MPSVYPHLEHIVSGYALTSSSTLVVLLQSTVSNWTYYYLQRVWITIRTEGHPADHIALINTSFAALSVIANSIETNQREDVRSVATLLYTGGCSLPSCLNKFNWHEPDLLKDETSPIDRISPTFASLKAILSIPVLDQSDSRERYQRTVHALLSSCLLNIDGMRCYHSCPCRP